MLSDEQRHIIAFAMKAWEYTEQCREELAEAEQRLKDATDAERYQWREAAKLGAQCQG